MLENRKVKFILIFFRQSKRGIIESDGFDVDISLDSRYDLKYVNKFISKYLEYYERGYIQEVKFE